MTITEILGRFKEKKATVVAAARMEADSCEKTIQFPDAVCGTLVEKLEGKKPRDSKRIDFINHAQCQAKVDYTGEAGFEGVNANVNRQFEPLGQDDS